MGEYKYDKNFRPLPIADLFQDEPNRYHFVIPSFQRGYRWERKQVLDLLEDIYKFSFSDETSYFLQPIVVRKREDNKWEVLDGQQRLTTMLLILKYIIKKRLSEDDRELYDSQLYDITYSIRPDLDFDNPDFKKTIDGFYLSEAKQTIERWFAKKRSDKANLSKMQECLLYSQDQSQQVKFIWYAIGQDSTDLQSINIFNRLNKGKIGLTSSELIKALLVLDKGADETAAGQLVMEWNEIEKRFQDDRFWFFISNNARDTQTRIDLLFDFLTGKPHNSDKDYSYRLFQNLYDYNHSSNRFNQLDPFWESLGVKDLHAAWLRIKSTFNILLGWYEDNMYYHYIGFLVNEKSHPMDIYRSLQGAKTNRKKVDPFHEWTRDDSEAYLKTLIKDKFKVNNQYITRKGIDDLEYSNSDLVRRLLLLFNIELCIKSGNQRFKFNLFKTERWDIEHVDSQNDSSLQAPEDRISWLRHIVFILKTENPDSEFGKKLLEECSTHLEGFDRLVENERSFSKELYSEIYKKVNQYFSYDAASGDKSFENVDLEKKNKDSINNLTLLNSDINRSYKDAPFPYKRYVIIDNDKKGTHFIPIGTRNLFLKYFTSSRNSVSQIMAMRWNEADKTDYLEYIHSVIDPIIL